MFGCFYQKKKKERKLQVFIAYNTIHRSKQVIPYFYEPVLNGRKVQHNIIS